ncbi:RagB/SusD family nutrient uptake outer membrane protein [Pedobacter antarcticus]|uniref:RagB/SusD family nutrient uptake outer membrane protein n=1 Tax=Pedobacter antarcticus TaxID=34086 RepID=UPI00292E5E12|nr:RagB/SusD family nutrient uptake outer membrane protein [Pedobacter antarcticus]
MTTYKNKIAGLLLLGILAAGCKKDFLDQHPLNQITETTYWTSPDDATMFANRMYEFLPQDNFVYYEACSDNAFTNDPTIRRFGNSTQDATISDREWNYGAIRQAYDFFANVDKVPGMDQNLKKRLNAEVKFVLAYRYFIMTALYGDIPFVNKLITDPKDADIPVTAKAEIIKNVIQWLDEAIADLPVVYSGTNQGRITKGAALALKSRVYLFNGNFAEAASAAQAVMDLKVYTLFPDYYDFYQKDGNYSSQDILSFGYTLSVKQNGLRDLLGSQALMNGRNIINPTAELVNEYESKNGYYPYTKDPAFSVTDPFGNRDPRLRQTILSPGDVFAYPQFPDMNQFDPFNGNGDRIGGDLGTRSGFSWAKQVDHYDYVRSGINNYKSFHYGEVLLNFAEAQNEVSGPSATIIAALDAIRSRAGMPGVEKTFAVNKWTMDQASLRTFIRHERRIELAGEGLRYFDVLRWKIGEKVLLGNIYTVDASAGIAALPITGGKKNTYPRSVIEDRYFNSPKFYYWPIPQSAIDASKGVLKQNALWK